MDLDEIAHFGTLELAKKVCCHVKLGIHLHIHDNLRTHSSSIMYISPSDVCFNLLLAELFKFKRLKQKNSAQSKLVPLMTMY